MIFDLIFTHNKIDKFMKAKLLSLFKAPFLVKFPSETDFKKKIRNKVYHKTKLLQACSVFIVNNFFVWQSQHEQPFNQ